MTPLTRIKLLVAAAGVSMWAMGVRLGDDRLRWGGIALLAVAFLLRLLKDRHGRKKGSGDPGG
ncbi:MAG: hypothetical protein ACYC2G_00115 [Gemmatimonadaceae bacterium]